MNQIDKSGLSPSDAQGKTAREMARFNLYLGVFSILSSLLTVFGLIELLLAYKEFNPTSPVDYPVIAISTSLAAALVSLYFARPEHLGFSEDSNPRELTLRQKSAGLIIAFTAYIVGLTTLTAWTGGAKASPYAALVLLTASLSAYVAQKAWTKAFVGVLAILSYALVSCWFFNRTTEQVFFAWPGWPLGHELIVVCIVVVISGFTSRKARRE